MKKLFFLLFLTVSLFSFGQNPNLDDVATIKFYGVDYSQAKVYGAAETGTEFKHAFDEINQLFITQPKKFDVGKRIDKGVNEVSLNAVNEVNQKINPDDLFTTNNGYTLDEEQISDAIKALPIEKEPGIGMVIVAKLLNKADNRGTYQIVYFNTETKEIVADWPTNGKARGFGLRNFWAGSVYSALKKL